MLPTQMRAEGDYLAPGSVLSSGSHSVTILSVISRGGFGVTYRVRNNVAFRPKAAAREVPEGETLVMKEIFTRGSMQRMADGFVTMEDGSDPQQQYSEFLQEAMAFCGAVVRTRNGEQTMPGLVHNFPETMRGDMEQMGAVPIYHAMLLRTRADSRKFLYAYLMPYIRGGQLQDRAGASGCTLSGRELVCMFYKLLTTLSYMHNDRKLGGQTFVHWDIKPANIMLTDSGSPILIDYGLTRALNKNYTHAASLYYACPEQKNGAAPCPAHDIYSLGATFFRLLTGHLLPKGLQLEDTQLSWRIGLLRSELAKIDGFRDFTEAYEAAHLQRTGLSYRSSNRYGHYSFSEMFEMGIAQAMSLDTNPQSPLRRWRSATEWLKAVFPSVDPATVSHGMPAVPPARQESRPASPPPVPGRASAGVRPASAVSGGQSTAARRILCVLVAALFLIILALIVALGML